MKTIGRFGVMVLSLGVSLFALPIRGGAETVSRVSRVGWLEVCGPKHPNLEIFRERLAELGYIEGKNLIIEQRFADCSYDRIQGLATELARLPVDVLFSMGTRAARIVAETVKTTRSLSTRVIHSSMSHASLAAREISQVLHA